MNFYEYANKLISEYFKKRDTIPSILQKIETFAKKGKIAFYPCSRYSNIILDEIRKRKPELLPKIKGLFDRSEEAITHSGICVYNINELEKFSKEISLLVICSNTFFNGELKELNKFTSYNGPFLNTSYFDISFKNNISTKRIIRDIKRVYNLLRDTKSRATYLITWLSRILNDENITYLFQNEKEIIQQGSVVQYGRYLIEGLDATCAKELYSELYKMRYVYPEYGDIVLDIGAYKGDSAIFFSNYIGNKGKVYAFEPTKSNFAMLLKNIKINRLEDIVTPINKGCSIGSGILKAVSTESGAPWSFLSTGKGNERVKVTSVDDFVRKNKLKKIDFIKIDAEGMEYDILVGARKTIKRMKPKMAIPLYHRTDDLTAIPLLVNKLANYKLYMRCKIEGPFGLTLFCKPRTPS